MTVKELLQVLFEQTVLNNTEMHVIVGFGQSSGMFTIWLPDIIELDQKDLGDRHIISAWFSGPDNTLLIEVDGGI